MGRLGMAFEIVAISPPDEAEVTVEIYRSYEVFPRPGFADRGLARMDGGAQA